MFKPTEDFARELIKYLPQRPDYQTWLYVISAIGNTFPEPVALEILLSHFKDERTDEHLYKFHKRLRNVTFATLVYLAKQYGYRPDSNYTRFNFYRQNKTTLARAERVVFNDPEVTFRFIDYEFEERAGIYEFEANMARLQAEKRLLEEEPNRERERTYRIAINTNVLNKNLDPHTRQPYKNYAALTRGFRNFYLTMDEIVYCISKGYAFCCCHFIERNGSIIRKSEAWAGSDLFAIDIDKGLTINEALRMKETQKALLIYTTPSHTEQQNRFRLVFPLPVFIKSREHFVKIVSHYIAIYNADAQCKDPVRAFYGNDNAIMYIIPKKEIMKFREGIEI